ncbi:hypothetical protein T492DRAFT_873077 [Pavlovales sp. CCMP2436]|nr:hypothetical protein T492DRAFT_873077 [Pavlovales sp. CCMP2436]
MVVVEACAPVGIVAASVVITVRAVRVCRGVLGPHERKRRGGRGGERDAQQGAGGLRLLISVLARAARLNERPPPRFADVIHGDGAREATMEVRRGAAVFEQVARVDQLRRALALNRMMRDEMQAALRRTDDAVKHVNRRMKEVRLELKRAQVDADDAALQLARNKRRQRAADESFFAGAGEGVASPEPNTDALRVRRLLRGIPLGGGSGSTGVWPRQWREELGRTVTDLMRARVLKKSRQQRHAVAALTVSVTHPHAPSAAYGSMQPFAQLGLHPGYRTDGSMPVGGFGSLPLPGTPYEAETPLGSSSAEGASPAECVQLLERELHAAAGPPDDAFWSEVAHALTHAISGAAAMPVTAEEYGER